VLSVGCEPVEQASDEAVAMTHALRTPATTDSTWAVQSTSTGLRLVSVSVRAVGSTALTWASLLNTRLSNVRVYVVYFPSRFDLDVDANAAAALNTFARQTSDQTSVNTWDPTDPNMDEALALFDITRSPALVLATGLKKHGKQLRNLTSLYAVTITDPAVLADHEKLARVVNSAHEVLMCGDADAIARYLRTRDRESILASVASFGHYLIEQAATLHPKLQLPGGVSLQLG
jgi:hypothetical protein